MPFQFSWTNNQKRDEDENKVTPFVNKYSAVQQARQEVKGPAASVKQPLTTQSVQQYNYQLMPQEQWTAPALAAFGRLTGNDQVFDSLNSMTDQRGSRYWQPYRGGRSITPQGCEEFFKNNFGYEGPFDQQFCNDINSLYGNDVRFSNTLGVSTPTKKSSVEEWAGWYATQIQDSLLDNNELNNQWSEARKAYNDYYDQYAKINGRAPSLEEFEAAVDLDKYSKIKTINDSLQYGTKLQLLPIGTNYSPDIITGLYQAKQNGEDINVDRDYFEDAVQYYMNPVQKTQSAQKYTWSNDNLNETSKEDRDNYLRQLQASGEYEEAAAFDYAWWAAQPHDDSISAEPSMLDASLGYYHDEPWFDRAKESIGDEYEKRLKQDGTMDNPGDNGDIMDQACWQLYNLEKTRAKTNEVQKGYEDVISGIQDYADKHLADYTADGFEDFKKDVLWTLDLENNEVLKPYLKNGYDPSKYCRDLHFSEDTIQAAIKHAWDGERLSSGVDYAAQADSEFEAPFAQAKPAELPMFYDFQQNKAGQQRMLDRNNAETAVTDAVEQLAESGAVISKGAIPPMNGTFDRVLSFGVDVTDRAVGLIGKLWKDVFGSKHSEKLGADFTDAEAAAVDPVLGQLDVRDMPDVLTTDDIAKIVNAKMMSRINDDSICLADGIINYALPGAEHLHSIMLDRSPVEITKEFNALTYRNIFNDRVNAGLSESAAAKVATFAATDINRAVNGIGTRYEGDSDLTDAAQKLLNDMAQEEGSKDSYDIYMAVSDDVRESVGDPAGRKADTIMQKLLPGLMLGSSEASTPGFRAETNRLTHDVATGTITAKDIIEGLDDTVPDATGVDIRQYEGASVSKAAEDFLRNGGSFKDTYNIHGTLYTKEEYNDAFTEAKGLMKKAGGFLGSDRAFDSMSQTLRDMIGYDDIVEAVKATHSEDDAQYFIDDAIHGAIEDIANPDQTYHTSPLMNGTTDFIGKLEEIGASKSESDIGANLVNTRQSWMEQNVYKKDLTGFSAAVAAFFGEEQSDTGKMVDLFRAYGKFVSRNELDAAWNAFASGKASYDEIEALFNERVQSTDGHIVNALNNPDSLKKTHEGLDEGMAKIRDGKGNTATSAEIAKRLLDGESFEILNQYPGIFESVDTQWIRDQLDNAGTFSEHELVSRISNELGKYDFGEEAGTAFTPEQLDNIDRFMEQYKSDGANGYAMAQLDAENLKNLYGIDLDGTGFANGSELLSYIDPDWSTPYGLNPGYTFGAVEAVGKGMGEGTRAVLKVPTLLNRLFHDIGYGIAGEEYDPNASASYRAFSQQDEQTRAMQQNVATKGQAFVEQGVSEVVRNTVSSAIGGMIGEAFAVGNAVRMTGMPVTIGNVAAAGEALQNATQIISRAPFATSVFLNEYDQQRNDGASVLKAAIRGSISAGIELGTEDLPFEKLYSFRMGGFSVGEHAINGATSLGGAALNWVGNSARNILTEISEEEASEFLGRLVDTGEAVINGEGFGEALKRSFAGYGEAAKDTAIATAFTTLIFSAADLGGVTADYVHQCMSEGREANVDRLLTNVQADILASKDEETKAPAPRAARPMREYNPATEVPYFGKASQETNGVTVEENVANQAEADAAKYNPAEQVPFFGNKGDTSGAVSVAENVARQSNKTEQAQADQTDAEEDGVDENGESSVYESVVVPDEAPASISKAAENTLVEAVKNYVRDASEENAANIGKAAEDMMNALSEERAEADQKAQEAASEETEESPQAQPEEEQGLALELSEGAQRVRDYASHAEAAIDNAIIDKGAEMETAKIVAADPGLRSREESIQKMQGQLQETQQKIAGMQQQAQVITNKMSQMYRAAMDAGLDARSPQVVNAQFQLGQSQQAVQADIGKETEKQNELARQVEEAQQQLEKERKRITSEAKEKATGEYAKKVQKAREKLAEPGAAKAMLDEMDKDAERELNSIRAKQSGLNVNFMFTNAEGKANKAAVQEEQRKKSDLYSEALPKSSGLEATERYTDPASYINKPVVTERRDSEWQDDAKHRQDRLNESIDEEQRDRMRNDFAAWSEENDLVNYVSVSPQVYALIQKKIAQDTSVNLMDNRYLMRPQTGDAAPVYSQKVRGRGFTVTIDRDRKGYSENPEDTGVYHAGDFLNDDGTVTGLAYRAIVAADPSFADNPNVLKVNSTQGGVDAVLNHVTENNRYLILSTPQQSHKYGEGSLDTDRYVMLTKDKGMQAYEREAARTQKVVDQYIERMRSANNALEQYRAEMNDPNADQNKAAIEYQKAHKESEKATRGYRAAQSEMEKAKQKLVEAQEFIRNYEASGGNQRNGKTLYVFDKAAIEDAKTPSEVYQEAFVRAADRVAENAFLSDEGIITLLQADAAEGNADAEAYIEKRFGSRSHEELGAALFDHFLQQELQKGYAEQYKGAVQVIDEKQLGDFVRANGGYSADGFGGEGFGKFIMPNYYFKNQAWMASEEAILKFVPESMYKGLIREANGNTADFNATKAKYNNELQSTIRRYAAEHGLSDTDASFLADTYGIPSEAPKKVGQSTIVTSDDSHYFGVPTKNLEDYDTNAYLRAEDGSYDVARAKRCLENELRYVVQLFENQEAGLSSKKFDSRYDYICVDYVDDHGYKHKGVKVGEYYSFWKNGSRFLPSYDELMEMGDKIVCNFYAKKGKNNQDSKVNFVLVSNRDHTIDLRRDMQSVDRDQIQSELAYRRGHQELVNEKKQAEEILNGITDDPDLKREAMLTALHSRYNLAKNELRTALSKSLSCTPETHDYYLDTAARLSAKVELYGQEIRNLSESAVRVAELRSRANNYKNSVGSLPPSIELKETRNRLEEERSKPQSPERDKRISELEAKIKELRPKMIADNVKDLNRQRIEQIKETRSNLLDTSRSAKDSYTKAKERYDKLTDKNGPYSDESYYDTERKMLAEIIPTLKERADQEASEAQEQPKPKRPDPIARQIAEAIVSDTWKIGDINNESDAESGTDIGLTPDGNRPKTTIGTVNTVNPKDYDSVYAIVRSMKRGKDGVTQVQALSPSDDLFHKYLNWKKNGEWNQQTFEEKYVPQFLEEMKQPEARKALNKLYQELKAGKNIALTCFCTDESTCHRSIIAGLLQGAGVDVTTESGVDYSKYYDMYKGKIGDDTAQTQEPEKAAPISDEVKLAALKNLSDGGADIADIRSKAIQDYHDKAMAGMSDGEKIDYVAALARQQAQTKDSYIIDPNVDYDAMLGDMVKTQDKKQKSREARRLRDIARKAGTYKTATGINKALGELDAIEKSGHDVTSAREALQSNLEAVTNPNQGKIDEVIDAVDDPEAKINLQLFSEKTPEAALNEAADPIDEIAGTLLDSMSAPREIKTGFEESAKNIKNADTLIDSPERMKEYEDYLIFAGIRIRDINDEIEARMKNTGNMAEQRKAILEQMEELRRQYVTPENNALLDQLYSDFKSAYDKEDVESSKNAKHSMQIEMDLALGDPANTWTQKERDEYDALWGQYQVIGRKMAEKNGPIKPLIDERTQIKALKQPYEEALIASQTADSIVNNKAVFGPEQIIANGDAEQASIHRKRREQDNKSAKAFTDALHRNAIHGKSTIYTGLELAEARTAAIDKDELADSKIIADALGRRVKELKTNIAIIDLAKAFASGVDQDTYNAQFRKSFDAIMEMNPQREFTPEGRAKYERVSDNVRKRLKDYIHGLSEEYSVSLDGDVLYTILDQQRLVFEAAVERAERISKNYYSISADSIGDVYAPNHGGHMPAQFLRMDVAMIRNAVKKWNPKRAITATLDTFPRVVESALGNDADVFMSQYVQPVRDAEDMVIRRQLEIRKQYDWMRKLDKDTKEAITKARHYGWTEDMIRRDHPEQADTIIRGVQTIGAVLDPLLPEINVSYSRNGIDPVLKREHYIPMIPEEQNKILRAMGIHASFEDISIKDFGKSADYTPVHEFFRYAYERKGEDLTGYEKDPCVILDAYVPSALQQIYQTDNIIRLRDLHECLLENGDYDDLGNLKKGGLSHFAGYLDEYAKVIAGKKIGHIDRAIESRFGRKFFSYAKALTQIKGQSATAGNMNVVAANFEPLTMCFGTNPIQTAKAVFDTIASRITQTDRDVIDRDAFFKVRTSEKYLADTKYQKLVQTLYKPAELSDSLISEIVVRTGYYNACHRLGIEKSGSTDLHRKAWKNADNFATKVMASKGRGEKAIAYNTATGQIIGQFLAESMNNLSMMAKDTRQYAGGTAKISAIHGAAKAIAAVLMAFAGHALINDVIGHETVVDPYGAIRKGLKNREEDETWAETAKNIGESIMEGANPFDNLLDNNSSIPIIGGIPVVSGIEQTFKNAKDAFEHAVSGEGDWAYDLASALLNWTPGGVATKRVLDTARAADNGYVLSQAGRFKYSFDPSAGNLILSGLFGPNSGIEGRAYSASGYRTQSDKNTEKILSLIDMGMPAYQAVQKVNNENSLKSITSEASKNARRDEDNTAALDEAKELRSQIPYPEDMSESAVTDLNDPTIQKGLDMWKETGLTTYPTGIKIYTDDPEYGAYVKYGNKDIKVDEQALNKMNADYYRRARHIIEDNDDPETVAKLLEKLNNQLKKEYFGGE